MVNKMLFTLCWCHVVDDMTKISHSEKQNTKKHYLWEIDSKINTRDNIICYWQHVVDHIFDVFPLFFF